MKKVTFALMSLVILFVISSIFYSDPARYEQTLTTDDGFLDLSTWAIDEVDAINVTGNWEVYIGERV